MEGLVQRLFRKFSTRFCRYAFVIITIFLGDGLGGPYVNEVYRYLTNKSFTLIFMKNTFQDSLTLIPRLRGRPVN